MTLTMTLTEGVCLIFMLFCLFMAYQHMVRPGGRTFAAIVWFGGAVAIATRLTGVW